MHGKNDRKLGFAGLVGVSAGSAVASGIFAFPGDFAAAGAGTASGTYGLAYSGRGNAGGGYVLLWTWRNSSKA